MPRPGPKKVQRYSLEFKLKAVKLSLDDALAVSTHLAAFARARCLVEAAYFEAAHRGDPTRARELLGKAKPDAFGMNSADYMRCRLPSQSLKATRVPRRKYSRGPAGLAASPAGGC